jgi:hypothetical protein
MPKELVKGAGRIYDRAELMELDGKVQDELRGYAAKALDALKIKYGPAHCEIMYTKKGPALIEMGARIDGSNVYSNQKRVQIFDRHQLELTVDAFCSPEQFLKRVGRPNKIIKRAFEVYLQSDTEGTLKGFRHLDKIRGLPSYWEMHLKLAPGDKLKMTIDMSTMPGIVWLAHDDKAQLLSDYNTVRTLEKDLYIL